MSAKVCRKIAVVLLILFFVTSLTTFAIGESEAGKEIKIKNGQVLNLSDLQAGMILPK